MRKILLPGAAAALVAVVAAAAAPSQGHSRYPNQSPNPSLLSTAALVPSPSEYLSSHFLLLIKKNTLIYLTYVFLDHFYLLLYFYINCTISILYLFHFPPYTLLGFCGPSFRFAPSTPYPHSAKLPNFPLRP